MCVGINAGFQELAWKLEVYEVSFKLNITVHQENVHKIEIHFKDPTFLAQTIYRSCLLKSYLIQEP